MKLVEELVHFKKWYMQVAVVSAFSGAAIELFMIKTGFYNTVTTIEAERRAEFAEFQAANQMSMRDLSKIVEEKFK